MLVAAREAKLDSSYNFSMMARCSRCVCLGGVQITLPSLESVVGDVGQTYLSQERRVVPASWAG